MSANNKLAHCGHWRRAVLAVSRHQAKATGHQHRAGGMMSNACRLVELQGPAAPHPPGRVEAQTPVRHKDVGLATIDLAEAAGLFDSLIVTLCYGFGAMILGISRPRRVGIGWRTLPCLHMPRMSNILRPGGSTHIALAWGVPIYSNGSFVALRVITVTMLWTGP